MFLINQETDFAWGKGVKPCPCCGAKAYFTTASSMSYYVRCSNLKECGMTGKEVSLPTYWRKGSKRLWSRLFTRAVTPWNKRA